MFAIFRRIKRQYRSASCTSARAMCRSDMQHCIKLDHILSNAQNSRDRHSTPTSHRRSIDF